MHERINLEALENSFLGGQGEEKVQNLPIFGKMIKKNGFWVILKVDEVYTDLHVEDMTILKNYRDDLKNYDIKFKINADGKILLYQTVMICGTMITFMKLI